MLQVGRFKPPQGTKLDLSHPLMRGIVGYWPMWEGGGARFNNLIVPRAYGLLKSTANGSLVHPHWGGGPGGTAICGGSTLESTATIAQDASYDSQTTAMTVAVRGAWLDTGSAFAGLIGNQTSAAVGWDIYQNGTGAAAVLSIYIGGVNKAVTASPAAIVQNKFYDMAFTYDGAFLRCYCNGLSPGSTAATANFSPGTDGIGFGQLSGGNTGNIGRVSIEYLAIWNRTFTPDEIKQLYCAPYGFFKQQQVNYRRIIGKSKAGVPWFDMSPPMIDPRQERYQPIAY